MTKKTYRILYWTPRVISILFIIFISLFSFDVFGTGAGFWKTLLALFVHLIPSFALLAALIIAWKYELVGAAIFFGFAAWYIWQTVEHPSWWPIISGPAIVTGLLFMADWVYKKRVIG